MPDFLVLDLPDLMATSALGRRLGERLGPGAVVGLVGTLGAGKTHLARAIAEGLGVPDGRVVTSPTFVLIQEYDGRLPVYHFDVYRLLDVAAFLDLGAAEYLEGSGVCLIEWADRVRGWLPAETLWVELEITGAESRRARISGHASLLGMIGDSSSTSTPSG
jgi:tRNA threonylcarbamoyladenosine biosynthesis protein TsaE